MSAESTPARKVALYTCAICGGRFESVWSREETAAEKLARFGSGANPRDVVLLCDGCHDELVRGEGSAP
jgi:hypothetical protein